MSKIRWLLAGLVVTLIGLVPVLAANSPASASPGAILKFDVMTPSRRIATNRKLSYLAASPSFPDEVTLIDRSSAWRPRARRKRALI